MNNGKNGWITKFLATALWGAVVVILLFMGKAVVANDQLSRSRDIHISTEARIERTELRKEIKLDLKDMKSEILVAIADLKEDIKFIRR